MLDVAHWAFVARSAWWINSWVAAVKWWSFWRFIDDSRHAFDTKIHQNPIAAIALIFFGILSMIAGRTRRMLYSQGPQGLDFWSSTDIYDSMTSLSFRCFPLKVMSFGSGSKGSRHGYRLLASWCEGWPSNQHIFPFKGSFQDDVPFPKVGDVSCLKGNRNIVISIISWVDNFINFNKVGIHGDLRWYHLRWFKRIPAKMTPVTCK